MYHTSCAVNAGGTGNAAHFRLVYQRYDVSHAQLKTLRLQHKEVGGTKYMNYTTGRKKDFQTRSASSYVNEMTHPDTYFILLLYPLAQNNHKGIETMYLVTGANTTSCTLSLETSP